MIEKYTILTLSDIKTFMKEFNNDKPSVTTFDTETTGLNLSKDVPFLFSFGYVTNDWKIIKAWMIDQRDVPKEVWDTTIYTMITLFNRSDLVIGHNIKYDLHMLHNIGYDRPFKRVSDTQIYIRLAHDALTTKEGGPPDDLKGYASKYIDKNAAFYQQKIKAFQSNLKRSQTTRLLKMLNDNFKVPEEFNTRSGKWTKGFLESLEKDKVIGFSILPKEIQDAIAQFFKDDINVESWLLIPKDILHPYAHYDVVYPLRIYMRNKPIIEQREQQPALQRENDLIIPLYLSERNGFPFNKEYALETVPKLRNYIIYLRNKLIEIAGEDVSVGQHELIKDIIKRKFNTILPKTNKETLETLQSDNETLMEFVDIILQLRSLEKWFSTYLMKYIESEYNGRIRTQFKQAGTVTGRLSSGFQQFPSGGITDAEGNIIFHPRSLVKVQGGEYDRIAYLDYSQIELRVQAIYTIFVNGGDLNLCRAFMPFKCINENGEQYVNGEPYQEHKWFLQENPTEEWHSVDIHRMTAVTAFGADVVDADLKHYRSLGKRTNFASNYGAGIFGVKKALHSNDKLAQQMSSAYSKTYPGVMAYRNYVQRLTTIDGYVSNLFNRRYYGASAHKNANYLVQGSAADIIKMKIIALQKYIDDKGYKTRILMNIHDEIQFEMHKDESDDILYEFKAIMEDLPNSPIPIVTDIEITTTTWDVKEDFIDE